MSNTSNPLENARKELVALYRERADIDSKIDAVEQTVKILEPVYGSHEDDDVKVFAAAGEMMNPGIGVTDRVRRVLNHYAVDRGLWPTQVRDFLIADGFDPAGRSNFMATIHTVLKRLVESGEATTWRDDGLPVYQAALTAKEGTTEVAAPKQEKKWRGQRIRHKRTDKSIRDKSA